MVHVLRFLGNLLLAPVVLSFCVALVSWPFAQGELGFSAVWRNIAFGLPTLLVRNGEIGPFVLIVVLAVAATALSAWRDRRRSARAN